MLPLGVAMGLAVPLATLVHSVALAAPLLAVVGALAGFFVVPMNALLQHRAQRLLGSGESIAVQNFNENLAVLAMLAAYAGLQAAAWPLPRLVQPHPAPGGQRADANADGHHALQVGRV